MKRIFLLGLIGLSLSTTSVEAQIIRAPTALSANSGSTGALSDGAGRPSPDSKGWSDPAIDHNRLIISNGTFQMIGPYKVKGSQFFLGQGLAGDIFSATEKAYNITISYNTYNQELEFLSTSNPDKPLVKEPGDLDSFIIQANPHLGTNSLVFVYGGLLGTKDKSYYELVEPGSRFILYKRYKSELSIDPDNYAETSLRQFDLVSEYFYYDSQNKSLKKIKASASSVTKEFKSIKDLSTEITDADFTSNPEEAMRKVIRSLNSVKKAF